MNNDVKKAIESLQKDCVLKHDVHIQTLINTIEDDWISVEEFESKEEHQLKTIDCWITYKGSVRQAIYEVHHHGGMFFFNDGSGCYLTECITAVMTIKKPEPKEL